MQCSNKFLIPAATPYSVVKAPNSQTKSSSFHPMNRTQKIYPRPKANHGIYGENASETAIPSPPNVKTITSTSNSFVKHCVKIRQSSSYRHFHGSVLIIGAIPVREIYSFYTTLHDRHIIECLLVHDNYHIHEEIDDPSVHTIRVNSVVMSKLSGVQSAHSVEVIALVRIPTTFHVASDILHEEDCRKWFSFPHRILVLDGIQDPGNLGTLLRSATAFRWQGGVFLLPGCCDPFNEKALRAGRGSCFQIQIVTGNWTHIETLRKEFQMKMLAGHPSTSDKLNPVLRLSEELADSLTELSLCLVLGSEGTGLSEISRSACELVSIPMAGEFESLNVSVAGGIFMYMLQPENNKVI